MIPKYTIEYSMRLRSRGQHSRFDTDDPVAASEVLEDLLERGFHIDCIKHEGATMPARDSDKMIKTAAGMLAAKHVCSSLGISPEEERFRFGFTA